MFVNVYSPSQIKALELNPWLDPVLDDPGQVFGGSTTLSSNANPFYFLMLQGASTAETDFRRPAKIKPKQKPKLGSTKSSPTPKKCVRPSDTEGELHPIQNA